MWYNEGMNWAALYLIFLLLSALCFARAATNPVEVMPGGAQRRNVSLVPLGLLFWVLVPLIQYARVVF